jgi:7,8-dihydropterin-6-yl-methyl-4-(beta-D-ribofuranosyl)aminobenzene 5'-phosphate synthase
MGTMRLSIIAENSTRSPFIQPEYGLSLHVSTGEASILVDTAQGMGFFANAGRMGIDLTALDMLALSHGHFDHVGGVASLYSLHGPMPLWAHPAVDGRHSRLKNGKVHFIGFHVNKAAIDFRPVTGQVEIASRFWALEVPMERRDPEFMKNPSHLVLDGPGGPIPDPFEDDLSFVVEGEKGISVLLGCAHAGVVNILEEVARVFGTRTFFTVAGGMHMADLGEAVVERITGVLAGRFSVHGWYPCHCTGFKAASLLASRGQNVDWGYAGTSIEL